MLILRSSPASPFGRKVKIAAAVLGLSDKLKIEVTADHRLGHGLVADLAEDAPVGVALLEALGHFIERLGESADLVAAADVDAGLEMAIAHRLGGAGQLGDGHGEAA